MFETELTLSGCGLPMFSARNCVQELTPVTEPYIRRSLDGMLFDLGANRARKYQTHIVGQDRIPPTLNEDWIGTPVKVGCIARLHQTFEEGQREVMLQRDPVDLSALAHDIDGEALEILSVHGRMVTFVVPPLKRGYITYRPILDMRLMRFSNAFDEWANATRWSMLLQEA